MALRGFKAIHRWADAIGPEDPVLARCTDPYSLRAILGISREKNLVVTHSRNSDRARKDVGPLLSTKLF